MHNLKTGLLAAVERARPPDVPRPPLLPVVLDDHVRNLKHLEWQRVLAVLAHRLEQTRQERRPHDLVLGRLGVFEDDCRGPVVFAVEPGEVFVVCAL